jgi:hypothetical protein
MFSRLKPTELLSMSPQFDWPFLISYYTFGFGIYHKKNCVYKSYILNGDYKVSSQKMKEFMCLGWEEETLGFA